jgi:HAMP domain-containing protein
MLMTFRAKLTAIVGVGAFAFAVMIGASWVITSGVGERLVAIQERFVPQLELGPQLEGQFEQLRRSLQDAVAARDGDALEATRDQYDALLQRLSTAHDLLPSRETDQLSAAVQDWFGTAYDLSRRMIEGETGEALVTAMSEMQAKQNRSLALLEKVTAFDRKEFARVFEATNEALQTGGRLRLGVGVGCLVFVVLLSLWLSRSVLRSLTQLGSGLERFGQGAFDQLIPVAGNDELAGLARRANQMAQNLQRLEAERQHEDWLKNALVGLAQEVRGELSPI